MLTIDDILKEFEAEMLHHPEDCFACTGEKGCPFENVKSWLSQKLTAYGEEQRREGYEAGLKIEEDGNEEPEIKMCEASCGDPNHIIIHVWQSEMKKQAIDALLKPAWYEKMLKK